MWLERLIGSISVNTATWQNWAADTELSLYQWPGRSLVLFTHLTSNPTWWRRRNSVATTRPSCDPSCDVASLNATTKRRDPQGFRRFVFMGAGAAVWGRRLNGEFTGPLLSSIWAVRRVTRKMVAVCRFEHAVRSCPASRELRAPSFPTSRERELRHDPHPTNHPAFTTRFSDARTCARSRSACNQRRRSAGLSRAVQCRRRYRYSGGGLRERYAGGVRLLQTVRTNAAWSSSECSCKRTHRGQGVAVALLTELEQWARELGYTRVVLETGSRLESAVRLYTRQGYERVPHWGQYVDVPESICNGQRAVTRARSPALRGSRRAVTVREETAAGCTPIRCCAYFLSSTPLVNARMSAVSLTHPLRDTRTGVSCCPFRSVAKHVQVTHVILVGWQPPYASSIQLRSQCLERKRSSCLVPSGQGSCCRRRTARSPRRGSLRNPPCWANAGVGFRSGARHQRRSAASSRWRAARSVVLVSSRRESGVVGFGWMLLEEAVPNEISMASWFEPAGRPGMFCAVTLPATTSKPLNVQVPPGLVALKRVTRIRLPWPPYFNTIARRLPAIAPLLPLRGNNRMHRKRTKVGLTFRSLAGGNHRSRTAAIHSSRVSL